MSLFTVGVILIFAGLAVTFLATLLMFFRDSRARGRTRGGALIMIGPIPLVFGTDKETIKILLILSIVLMILALALMLLPHLVV
ncbi:MAG: DUF131 domain-containing protein [Candidatus Bathyarchaeota archaeon]|nr:DUF131 domain-containing protein [Candidatus Bathyarchaeota archaeon]